MEIGHEARLSMYAMFTVAQSEAMIFAREEIIRVLAKNNTFFFAYRGKPGQEKENRHGFTPCLLEY